MKTLANIVDEIKTTSAHIQVLERESGKTEKKMRKHLTFLRQMKIYIEHAPSVQHLISERERILIHLERAKVHFRKFDYNPGSYQYKKLKAEHDKLFETKLYREQLKTVNYLLS